MNRLNKTTVPAYIVGVINLLFGVYCVSLSYYVGANLIVVSIALILLVFMLNKEIMWIEERSENKDHICDIRITEKEKYIDELEKNSLEKMEIISRQNRGYAGLYNTDLKTLKIIPELIEIIIKRDALLREIQRIRYADESSINHSRSKAEKEVVELEIILCERNQEIINLLTSELLKETK